MQKDLFIKEILPIIKGIAHNSKDIKPGYLFVAIKGLRSDGHEFIKEALQKGASYIVYDKKLPRGLPNNKNNFIKVEDSRKFLSIIASEYFSNQPDNIVAVTGTNGKTSVVSFFRQILEHCNKKAVSIGTIGIEGIELPSMLTTPDTITLHHALNKINKQNIDYVAMEASSHGLEQHRLDGVKLKAAAFTNFSQDHLDYHNSKHDYFMAKMRLFSDVLKNGMAVINSDIDEFSDIKKICHNHKIIEYGKKAKDLVFLSSELKKDKNALSL